MVVFSKGDRVKFKGEGDAVYMLVGLRLILGGFIVSCERQGKVTEKQLCWLSEMTKV